MLKRMFMAMVFLVFILPIVSANNIQVASENYVQTVYPCNPASFTFEIYNIGTYIESYYISVDKFGDYTTLTENPVNLAPSHSRQVVVFINPSCDVTGTYDLNLIVRTLNSRQEVRLPIQLNIIDDYHYDLFFGKMYEEDEEVEYSTDLSYSICAEDTEKIPVIIKNQVNVPNSYSLKLRGPNFASLSQRSAVLDRLQKGVVFIDLEPIKGQEKEYPMTVYTTSLRGDIRETGALNVEVTECYGVEVELPEKAIVPGCEATRHEFNISNKGISRESFDIHVDAPSWVSMDYNVSSIGSDDKEELEVEFNPPCYNRVKRSKITLTARSQEHENIEDSASISVDIVPAQRFYDAKIEAPRVSKVWFDSKELPVTITNKGLDDATYSLSVTAPNLVDIEPSRLTVNKGETKEAKLVYDVKYDTIEDKYAVTIIAEGGSAVYKEDLILALYKVHLSDKVYVAFRNIINWFKYYLYYIIIIPAIIAALIPVSIKVIQFVKYRKEEIKSVLKKLYPYIAGALILATIVYTIRKVDLRSNLFFVKLREASAWITLVKLKDFISNYVGYIIIGLVILGIILFSLVTYEKKKLIPVPRTVKARKHKAAKKRKSSKKKASRKKASKKRSKSSKKKRK